MKNPQLIAALTVCYVLVELSAVLSGPVCDSRLFSVPYLRVFEKRNGPHLAGLDETGFLDMTNYIHKLLCLNGPAVIYGDLKYDSSSDQIKIFTDGNLKIFDHECQILNQISTSKAIDLREDGNLNPSVMDVSEDDFVGSRVTGIYLVAKKDNYWNPTSVLFHKGDLDYIISSSDSVDHGSFVTVGKGPFCLTVKNKFDVVLHGPGLKEDAVCKWTFSETLAMLQPNFKLRYEKIFDGSMHPDQFKWRNCAGEDGGDGLGPYPDGLSTPPPFRVFVNYDPFSIMDPKIFPIEGQHVKLISSRNASLQSLIGNFQRGNKTNINDAKDNNDELDKSSSDHFFVQIDENMCQKLPERIQVDPEDCPEQDDSCTIMQKAALSPQEPEETRDLMDKLKWKKDEVLDLIAEIFGKICKPFPPDMPFTVNRIIEFYLARSHQANPNFRKDKQNVWDFLISELQICNRAIKVPMYWYWDDRDEFLPVPEPPIDCKVTTCSDGCTQTADEKFCEPLDPCTAAVPECDPTCKYDEELMECVDSSNDEKSCEASITPTCEPTSCHFDSYMGQCVVPTCKATECNDPGCHAQGDTCEDGPSGGGGATPSHSTSDSTEERSSEEKSAKTPTGSRSPPPRVTFEATYFQQAFRNRTKEMNFEVYPSNITVVTKTYPKNYKSSHYSYVSFDVNATTRGDGNCLFFYEDMAESDFDLNIAIDIHWKMWATVIGYCNAFYPQRKAETFPRLYNTYFEDFLSVIQEDWKYPKENDALRIILNSYNSEISQRWLDTCLESSYYVSYSSTYRPPRPITIGNEDTIQSNYFIQTPDFIKNKFINVSLSETDKVKCFN